MSIRKWFFLMKASLKHSKEDMKLGANTKICFKNMCQANCLSLMIFALGLVSQFHRYLLWKKALSGGLICDCDIFTKVRLKLYYLCLLLHAPSLWYYYCNTSTRECVNTHLRKPELLFFHTATTDQSSGKCRCLLCSMHAKGVNRILW